MAEKSSNLINRLGLQRRFFLKIPVYKSEEGDVKDFFGSKKQQFPWSNPEKSEPDFVSDEIVEAIKVVPFVAKGHDCFNPFSKRNIAKSGLINYCTTGTVYLIPLFLLDGTNDAWLSQIINRISENIQFDIMSDFDEVEESGKKLILKIYFPMRLLI